MRKEMTRNLRLGIFVAASTVFLILALYFVGNNRNLFGSILKISARFHHIDGLMEGSNVRFAGIDVGTVESVNITSDTTVTVVMIINRDACKYIKKNAVVTVSTDGLMGNKLVNINSVAEPASEVEDGDVLKSLPPVETAEMLRTLDITNENIRIITGNLKNITQKINSSNSLWSLLMDTVVAENVKNAIVNIKITGSRTAAITGDLSAIVNDIKGGKGTLGALITDTAFSSTLEQTIVDVQVVSNEMAIISGDLRKISARIEKGEGAIGTLLMDTAFVHNLNSSMANINEGSGRFTEIMEGLKHSVFLRRYFKKQAKKKEKEMENK
jgi:phospholipid/cholesterol/gamma-HCH transport system substrate-binding protein